MKRIVIFAIVCLLMLPSTAFSQGRSRRTSKRGTASSRTQKSAAEQAAVEARTEGASRVATQIKNLTMFLYLLGGVAKEIEALDAAAKSGQASPTNERNKAQLRASFENFRVALDQLESDFRATPELQQYYLKLVGSAAGASDAEGQAAAGHFNQAGRTLLGVVDRLTDVLLAMR